MSDIPHPRCARWSRAPWRSARPRGAPLRAAIEGAATPRTAGPWPSARRGARATRSKTIIVIVIAIIVIIIMIIVNSITIIQIITIIDIV